MHGLTACPEACVFRVSSKVLGDAYCQQAKMQVYSRYEAIAIIFIHFNLLCFVS